MSRGKKKEEMRRKLVECEKRESELRERCGVLERKVEQLQRESDSKQKHHANQVTDWVCVLIKGKKKWGYILNYEGTSLVSLP